MKLDMFSLFHKLKATTLNYGFTCLFVSTPRYSYPCIVSDTYCISLIFDVYSESTSHANLGKCSIVLSGTVVIAQRAIQIKAPKRNKILNTWTCF